MTLTCHDATTLGPAVVSGKVTAPTPDGIVKWTRRAGGPGPAGIGTLPGHVRVAVVPRPRPGLVFFARRSADSNQSCTAVGPKQSQLGLPT